MTLISRNSKDLIIHDTQITNSINKKEKHEVDVLVESNIYCKLYNFTIERCNDPNNLYNVKIQASLKKIQYPTPQEHISSFYNLLGESKENITKNFKESLHCP